MTVAVMGKLSVASLLVAGRVEQCRRRSGGQSENLLPLGFVYGDTQTEVLGAGAEGAFAGVAGWMGGVDGGGGLEEVDGSGGDGG